MTKSHYKRIFKLFDSRYVSATYSWLAGQQCLRSSVFGFIDLEIIPSEVNGA
jgi:hypothetical protein